MHVRTRQRSRLASAIFAFFASVVVSFHFCHRLMTTAYARKLRNFLSTLNRTQQINSSLRFLPCRSLAQTSCKLLDKLRAATSGRELKLALVMRCKCECVGSRAPTVCMYACVTVVVIVVFVCVTVYVCARLVSGLTLSKRSKHLWHFIGNEFSPSVVVVIVVVDNLHYTAKPGIGNDDNKISWQVG